MKSGPFRLEMNEFSGEPVVELVRQLVVVLEGAVVAEQEPARESPVSAGSSGGTGGVGD